MNTTTTGIKDLAELDIVKGADEGHEFELRHPVTADPIGAFITVIGEDSEKYQEQLRALRKKAADALVRARRINALDDEEEGITLLVAATRGWRNLPPVDGKPLDYSAGNARLLYKRFPWIREQVAGVIRERANFLPKSAAGL